ncbi:MAG: hypothetical protein ACYC1Q_11895 [Bacteroidia bacterium]
MKNLYTLALGVLFSLSSKAQTMTGFRMLHDSNAKEVSAYLIESFARDLETQIRNGNIRAFSDKEIKSPLSIQSAINTFYKPVRIQMINPYNPDDPYDLIDTMIYEPILPRIWFSLEFSSKSILLRTDHSKSIYLSKMAVPLVSSFPLFFDLSKNAENGRIDFSSLPFLLSARLDSLQWKLYTLMFYKKQALYTSVDGSSQPNGDNTWFFPCDIHTNYQIINPANPDDPYDLIDTVVVTRATPEFLDGIYFGNQLDLGYSISLQAISIYCDEARFRYFQNYYLSSSVTMNWYWILWQDLYKQINKEDQDLLLFLNAWCFLNPSP